jgi:ATP-dependent Clp protease ATP-binding subunit ClpC
MQLSDAFNQVLEWAVNEADQSGHWYIGPEHLLLGLLRLSEGEVVELFNCLGVNRQELREKTREAVKQTPYDGTLAPNRFIRFINRVFGIDL